MTIAVGSTEVIAWDRAGRLYSVWRDGATARRGLSGRVLLKSRAAGVTCRSWLEPDAVNALTAHAAARAAEARQVLDLAPDAAAVLERAAGFDAAAARADAQRFASIYSDIGVLPPDQYLATVIQATEGCSVGTCEFCDLFARPFRARRVDEFRAHVGAVRDYLGDSLLLRDRSVFLGAANALALPVARLEALFGVIREELGRRPITGFLDAHTGVRKTAEDFRRLRALGLHRVYIGLESGHDPLLAFVRKPSCAADAIEIVRAMKAAGVACGIIVMLGLGGEPFSEAHVADTIAVLNAMPLGAGDLVYFSDLVVSPGGRYAARAEDAGLRAVMPAARRAQRDRIRAGLVFDGAAPQLATYDIREFVY